MILRNEKEVKYLAKEGKVISQVDRISSDGTWNIVFPSTPWYSEYGVVADYVISNGIDNWIDTWLAMNVSKDGIIIEMDIEYLNITNTEINAFGAVDGSGSTRNVVEAGSIVNGKDAFYSYSSSGSWKITNFDVEPNIRYNLKYEFKSGLQVMYVDDVEVYRTTDTTNITSSNAMTLFARSYSNNRGGFTHAKWHNFKLSKLDGTPIADYMPLYVSKKTILDRESNIYPVGSYVLVDNVREEATVLHGAPLEGFHTPWWSRYGSETPYVITNGTNNYIDTGIITQTDLNIELDVEYLKVDGTSEHLFGGVNGTGFNRRVIELGFINSGKLTYAYGYSWTNTDFVPQQDTPYKISAEFINGSQKMYVNGAEEYATSNTTAFDDVPISMYLFTRNEFGTPASNMATVKLKGCKVSKPSGEVLLDYTPIYIDKEEMIDINGRVYPVGSFVLVDNISEKVATLYGDDLKGLWWREYGDKVEYLENADNESYIVTDVTPTPDKLSLDIECTFLNDLTSAPFGCRPIETASLSSNNIFQIGNTLRVDLLGDASLIIPKENNTLYNITYSGTDNIFTINGKSYNNLLKKSSTEVIYPFAIFANNSGGVLSVGSACIMRYNKFNINEKQYIPIKVKKQFTDKNNVVHNVGDFIMVNDLIDLDVPSHTGIFTGPEPVETPWWEEYGEKAGFVFTDGKTNYIETKSTIPSTSVAGSITKLFDIEGYRLRFNTDEVFCGVNFEEDDVYNSVILLATDENNEVYVDISTIPDTKYLTESYLTPGVLMDLTLNLKSLNNGSIYYITIQGGIYENYVVRNVTMNANDNQSKFFMFALNNNGVPTNHAKMAVSMLTMDGVVYNPLKITKKNLVDDTGNIYPIGNYALVNYETRDIARVCGNALEGVDGIGELDYTLSADGTYYINTGRGSYQGRQIVLPETYNNLPVLGIGEGAYMNDQRIDYIDFHSPIEFGASAFENSSLASFSGDFRDATSVGSNLFKNCVNLTEANLSVIYLTSSGMFEGCTNLTTVAMADYLETIETGMFKNCTSLTSVDLSTSLQSIKAEAFAGCTSLSELNLSLSRTYLTRIALENANAIADNTNILVNNFTFYEYISDPVWSTLPNYRDRIIYENTYSDFAEHADYVVVDGTQYINTNYDPSLFDGNFKMIAEPDAGVDGYIFGVEDSDNEFTLGAGCISDTWYIDAVSKYELGANVPGKATVILWEKYKRQVTFNGVTSEFTPTGGFNTDAPVFALSRNDGAGNSLPPAFSGKVYNIYETAYSSGLYVGFNYQPIRLTTDYEGHVAGTYMLYDMTANALVPIEFEGGNI